MGQHVHHIIPCTTLDYQPLIWPILGIILEDWCERGQTNHMLEQFSILLLLFDSIPIQRKSFAH